MRGVLEDLRYAMRVLRRTPTLTAVAVLTLALGIAAITTVFGWIDGMVLHPFRGARDDGQLAVLESVSATAACSIRFRTPTRGTSRTASAVFPGCC